MELSTAEQLLIEQRVTNEAKSTGLAYVFWFFLGCVGAHRFYLGRTGSGAAMLVLLVAGVATAGLGIGSIAIVAVGIWAIVDLFLIPGIVRDHKDEVRNSLRQQMAILNQAAIDQHARLKL